MINGKRGVFLLCYVGLYLVYAGISLVPRPKGMRPTGFAWLPHWVPSWSLALPWLIAAIVAASSARRKPPKSDKYGFVAIVVPPLLYSVVYLINSLLGIVPLAWILIAYMAATTAPVLVVAGWENPPPRTPEPRLITPPGGIT